MSRRLLLLATLVLASPAWAEPAVTEEEVRALLAAGRCREARLLIQNAPNREAFLQTAVGKAYYAGSLCFSDPRDLTLGDVGNGRAHAEVARAELVADKPFTAWLDAAVNQCRRTEQQIARGTRDPKFGEYRGKIAGRCTQNASPALLRWNGAPAGDPTALLRTLPWVALPPPQVPGAAADEQPPVPPEELVARALKEHVVKNARQAACAPFLVVSASQDPAAVCSAAKAFYGHFRETYGSQSPGAWITLHHYAETKAIKDHAGRYSGPECGDLLGYYDWRRQTIAFRAPPGLFGTLQHELTHALMYWDSPLGPGWFEEGVAALYENTDKDYRGLPNPWREAILKGIKDPERRFLDSVIRMSTMEFEESPVPSTLARAAAMKLQEKGKLAGVYGDLRSWASSVKPMDLANVAPHQMPPKAWVDAWRAELAPALGVVP